MYRAGPPPFAAHSAWHQPGAASGLSPTIRWDGGLRHSTCLRTILANAYSGVADVASAYPGH